MRDLIAHGTSDLSSYPPTPVIYNYYRTPHSCDRGCCGLILYDPDLCVPDCLRTIEMSERHRARSTTLKTGGVFASLQTNLQNGARCRVERHMIASPLPTPKTAQRKAVLT